MKVSKMLNTIVNFGTSDVFRHNFFTCINVASTGFPQLLENLEKLQVFPVLEKYWNFIILLKILEKWE